MAKITVEMEDELLQRFRLAAVKERKTLSEVVRGLVGSWVKAKEISLASTTASLGD